MNARRFGLARAALSIMLLLGPSAACATARPARYVVERDLGPYFYRRYQKTLDVEFVIAGNPATGHTATYLRRDADSPEFATAFVTVYERAQSLCAEVSEGLGKLERYERAVAEVEGGHAWRLARLDEHWLLWVSGRHVVKLGAPRGEQVPEALASAYMDVYPSELDDHGHAREDAQCAGRSAAQRQQERAEAAQRPSAKSLRPAKQ